MQEEKNFSIQEIQEDEKEDEVKIETPILEETKNEVYAEPDNDEPIEERKRSSNNSQSTVMYHLREIFRISSTTLNREGLKKKLKVQKIVTRIHIFSEILKAVWLYIFATVPFIWCRLYVCYPPNFIIYIIHIITLVTQGLGIFFKDNFPILFINGFLSFLLTCGSLFLVITKVTYSQFRFEMFMVYPSFVIVCSISFGCWVKHAFDWHSEMIIKKIEKNLSSRIEQLQKMNATMNEVVSD